MTTAADIVAEAWEWWRTPFHWQASLKGVGADCKGLVAGVLRELGLPEGRNLYAAMVDYGGRVPIVVLKQGLAATFAPARTPCAGDVLLMRMAGVPQHLGIHCGDVLMHTYNGGPKMVIPTSLKVALRAWPLVSAWRLRSLAGAE